MSFSVLAQATLEVHMPDTSWRILVAGLGYSVGFLMTILARQQLFTESTITVVLPVLKELTWKNVWRMLRLWINRARGQSRRHAICRDILPLFTGPT